MSFAALLAAAAAVLPPGPAPGLVQDVVVRGLDAPTAVAPLPDGRLLVAEKAGLLRIAGAGRLARAPALDLRARVDTFNERGLMAVTAAPDFARSGHVFVLYAVRAPGRPAGTATWVRVSRFTLRGGRADPAAERVLLGPDRCAHDLHGAGCIPVACGCHMGGDVRVARDGSLLVSTGDGTGAGAARRRALLAQDPDVLAGKLLRLAPDGRGRRDNPYAGRDLDANRARVWATGLRNPFRFSLGSDGTTALVADVGWRAAEEVDVVERAANLGWPCYEGRRPQPAYAGFVACRRLLAAPAGTVQAPRLAYGHGGRGASVTGGPLLPQRGWPAGVRGAFVLADFQRGWIRAAPLAPPAAGTPGPRTLLRGADGPVDLELAADGSLLYVAIGAGEVRRLRPLPAPG